VLLIEEGKVDLNIQERLLENIPALINNEDIAKINQSITENELLEALQKMQPNKAPGPDGFFVHFYHKCWNIIKKHLLRMVQIVQKPTRMGGNTNSTFLALIPNEANPSSFSVF
jgi:hypothetical protein